jgi:hypothetical protein
MSKMRELEAEKYYKSTIPIFGHGAHQLDIEAAYKKGWDKHAELAKGICEALEKIKSEPGTANDMISLESWIYFAKREAAQALEKYKGETLNE